MSKYSQQPLDFSGLSTVPLASRDGKVRVEHMGRPHRPGASLNQWLDSLPHLLAADSLRAVARAVAEARRRRRAIIWAIGGHVIKCGLAPVLGDLMARGFLTAVSMNGAASIHDFEIALAGSTSEDVEAVLPGGRFGATEETGRLMNEAIAAAVPAGTGMGEALGAALDRLAKPEYAPYSVLLQAWRRALPVTVHVAVGTDTPHMHPAASGEAIGAASHRDFRLFCALVRGLHGGGVFLNVGSAVVLPEVFLKAVSVVRNLHYPLADFTTVNLDFLQHYRPRLNVVERPHAQSGGAGYSITGHHEILVPLLAALLVEADS